MKRKRKRKPDTQPRVAWWPGGVQPYTPPPPKPEPEPTRAVHDTTYFPDTSATVTYEIRDASMHFPEHWRSTDGAHPNRVVRDLGAWDRANRRA